MDVTSPSQYLTKQEQATLKKFSKLQWAGIALLGLVGCIVILPMVTAALTALGNTLTALAMLGIDLIFAIVVCWVLFILYHRLPEWNRMLARWMTEKEVKIAPLMRMRMYVDEHLTDRASSIGRAYDNVLGQKQRLEDKIGSEETVDSVLYDIAHLKRDMDMYVARSYDVKSRRFRTNDSDPMVRQQAEEDEINHRKAATKRQIKMDQLATYKKQLALFDKILLVVKKAKQAMDYILDITRYKVETLETTSEVTSDAAETLSGIRETFGGDPETMKFRMAVDFVEKNISADLGVIQSFVNEVPDAIRQATASMDSAQYDALAETLSTYENRFDSIAEKARTMGPGDPSTTVTPAEERLSPPSRPDDDMQEFLTRRN